MPAERGFTLLEILAALAIVAVGIAAVAKATGNHINTSQLTEDRLLGSWVAANRMAELRISPAWPTVSERQGQATLGGRQWHYIERIVTTKDPDILRVDIDVYTDAEFEDKSALVFGYLARRAQPLAPAQPPQSPPDPTEPPQNGEGGTEAEAEAAEGEEGQPAGEESDGS